MSDWHLLNHVTLHKCERSKTTRKLKWPSLEVCTARSLPLSGFKKLTNSRRHTQHSKLMSADNHLGCIARDARKYYINQFNCVIVYKAKTCKIPNWQFFFTVNAGNPDFSRRHLYSLSPKCCLKTLRNILFKSIFRKFVLWFGSNFGPGSSYVSRLWKFWENSSNLHLKWGTSSGKWGFEHK